MYQAVTDIWIISKLIISVYIYGVLTKEFDLNGIFRFDERTTPVTAPNKLKTI